MANPHLIGPLVRRFLLDEVGIERNLSINTQRSYRDTLRLLFHFLAERYAVEPTQVTVEQLTVDVIKHFLIYLEEERGNTIDTRNLRLTALHSFFRFVYLHGRMFCQQFRHQAAMIGRQVLNNDK